jgi:hypothetical protein
MPSVVKRAASTLIREDLGNGLRVAWMGRDCSRRRDVVGVSDDLELTSGAGP